MVKAADFARCDRGFDASRFGCNESESIASDCSIWQYDHPRSDLAPITDAHTGMQERLIADSHISANADMSNQPAVIANIAVRAYPAEWPDRDIVPNRCAGINNRRRMHSGRDVHRAFEKLEEPGQDQPRTLDNNLVRSRLFAEFFRGHHI